MDTSSHISDFVKVNGIRLHYLDWGGEGPMLIFLAGMGCPAYIFSRFAPRFVDKFHVLALDRRGHGDSDYPETGYDPETLTEDLRQFLDALNIEKVILAGHSLAYIELCHFTASYPERILKLVFLDAAYDNSSPETRAVFEKNPLSKIIPAWPEDDPDSIEDYIAILKKLYPALAMIWDEMMDEQAKHTVKITPEGKVTEKMSDAIAKAINDTSSSYAPEYSKIRAPVLSFFAIRDGSDYLSSDYMTEEQRTQVTDFFKTVLQPYNEKYIQQFREIMPHAKIVVIPGGHHYCFIKQEEFVLNEMREFLLEGS
jgi:pimeloyl-ACP methyl ester carboxylesterase